MPLHTHCRESDSAEKGIERRRRLRADRDERLESPESLDPANAAFARDIAAWSKICDRLYIRDYVIEYAHSIMPFPNLYSLAPNIRFFIRNGVKGIYEEADYFTKGGELAERSSLAAGK